MSPARDPNGTYRVLIAFAVAGKTAGREPPRCARPGSARRAGAGVM